jgi:hypothetical protein
MNRMLFPLVILLSAMLASVLAGTPRAKRVLCFVTDSCIPCNAAKRECEEWMRPSGWTFGTTADCHVQYVDDSGIAERYKVETFPTFVLIVDEKELKRQTGYDMTLPVETRRRVIVELMK